MVIENSPSLGSMYGCVDSLHNLSSALQEILGYLPDDFVWPTILDAKPFGAYAEWGRHDTQEEMERSVWITATPEGVKMNANFRPDWPDCGASDFDAQIAAEWLQELTKNWSWNATRSGGHVSSSISQPSGS